MSAEVQKRLRLVTFWLFGSALILSAAWVAYMALWIVPLLRPGESPAGYILAASWPIVLITFVVAAVLWAGYRYLYLPRNAQ